MDYKKIILVLLFVVGAFTFLLIKLKVPTEFSNWSSAHSSEIDVNWKKELEKIKEQLRKNPDSSVLHHQAAVVYAALEDYKNFELEIMKAIELEPDNSMNYYTAAAVYQRLRKYDKEEEFVWKALEADSQNPFGHYYLAELYVRREKWDWAVLQYERADRLLKEVSGDEYTDYHGNHYNVSELRKALPDALEKARKSAAEKK